MGFVPGEGEARDVTIGSATASTLTASNGSSYRISSGAVVLSGSETYDYSTSGYLQLNSRAGSSVRLFADDTGAIRYLYLSSGTTSASQAAVADTSSAASSLARALGISGRSYAITKNGAAASSGDLAEYDVAYYDAATGTMRASDYKVTGYISAASPNVTAAETITVAGCEFPVLESAWESLAGFRIGDAVTLLLTDDGKVAGACAPSEVRADMVGILSEDGRSVTLCDSGVTITASTIDYEEDMLGSLVWVSSSSSATLRCTAPLLQGKARRGPDGEHLRQPGACPRLPDLRVGRLRLCLRPGGEPGLRLRRLLLHRLDGYHLLRLRLLLPDQQRRAGGSDPAGQRHRRLL